MSELFEDVQKHVEHLVSELEGNADYMPTMLARDHEGKVLVVGILLPDDADGKDMAAAAMAAVCILYRATEAAFTSAAWRVISRDGKMPDLPPSECPDREEVVMVSAARLDGSKALLFAPLIRENNKAGVGLWEDGSEGGRLAGRFMDAMRMGIKMGQLIPPDLAAWMDQEIAAGREPKVLQMLTETYIKQKELAEEAAKKEAKAREN
jgi:hypothetical protein